MPLETLYLTGVIGATEVSDPRLAYSEVMLCMREGKPLVETTDTPTGRRFRHNSAGAKLELPATIPIEGVYGYDPGGQVDILLPEEFIINIKY